MLEKQKMHKSKEDLADRMRQRRREKEVSAPWGNGHKQELEEQKKRDNKFVSYVLNLASIFSFTKDVMILSLFFYLLAAECKIYWAILLKLVERVDYGPRLNPFEFGAGSINKEPLRA